MRSVGIVVLLSTISFVRCTHFNNEPVLDVERKSASISPNTLVEFPALGLTVVIKDRSAGLPVAAIFDKSGEFYPELQSKINRTLKASALVNLVVISSQVIPENKLYKESKEKYATLIINAKTLNALNKKEQLLKFAVPVERMIISQKGGKAQGLGYWNTTDVRPLDPQQALPF